MFRCIEVQAILDKLPSLSDTEVLETTRRYLNSGQIVYKKHFKKRMDERDVTLQDIIYLVETGKVKGEPEWNNDYDEYNYCISGEDIEGIELTVIISISTENEELNLITVF